MTHKIMVVDDNTATRRMVRNALQRRGHDVVEAADGKSAREMMSREKPVLVIQDLMLPDADGFTLVGELRDLAAGSDVSILAFSGFVSELEEARMSTVGFDDIISKPIAPSRLIPIVEAHLPTPVALKEQFGAGRRLVLADDDPMQLKLASYRLTRLGFVVEAVADGAAVLEAIRRHAPDAIVSDVMMPELDGFGLAMAVRQDPALRRLPVVLVTSSYVEPADRDLARRAGATDLVPRTPELVEVLEALRSTFAAKPEPRIVPPEVLPELEREHGLRVFRQLERQVMINTGLAKRCSVLSSELAVLTGISEAVLKHRDIDIALDEALAACFDAGGISIGALYLVDPANGLRVRPIGNSLTPDISTDLATLFGHEELLRTYIAEGDTLTVPSPVLDKALEQELLRRAQASAMLMVPIVHLERKLGSLLMVARGRELDHDDWRTFAHGVATQISHVLALAGAYADREAAERRATEHAALLDAVVDNAPDFVVQLDLDGTIRFINRAESPYDVAPQIGTNIFDYPAGDHASAMREALARVAETGEPQGFEAQLLRTGKQVWYSTRLGPIKQRGQVTGAVLVARDVSEGKQTELHLMVADRMASVGTLAAGVAHEINNPLASVIANLDMAMQDLETVDRKLLPSELVEELGDARTAADRVREIVRDLKIFSRAEEERRGPVDVENVLESTLRMAWNELRHRAKLVKVFNHVPEVEANESRLGQVFLNLIINAAHAIPPGNYEANQIKVTTSTDALGRVVIAIADTGTGIPVEARQRLFTPFFTTKPVGVGTGLGLAISHRIITQFGGTITFETELGKGTEFRVTLPPSGSRFYEPASVRAKPTIPPSRRGTVLVIDDEEPLALAVQRFLSHEHQVTAVHSARAALDMFEAGTRFDVILCDLMMPQVTGMELHAALAKIDAAQADRVVFMTGGAFTTSAREFLDHVGNARVEKPFDLKELRKVVNDRVR
ncbi:MAG: response regulator [Kofleriaceae bacterium]